MEKNAKILTKNLDKKKRIRKILLIILIVILVIVIAFIGLLFGVGNYLTNFAVQRNDNFNVNLDPSNDDVHEETEGEKIIASNREAFDDYREAWLDTVDTKAVSVTSYDDLTLKGNIYYADETSHDWALLLHGYRDTSASMLNFAAVYNQVLNINCLVPDMRACGESEGEYLGMGYLDSQDALKWIDLIVTEDSEANIFVSGVSMGGATTMMTSGLNLPDNVKCFIEDCGYTSVWDIFAHELDYLFHLPTFPVLDVASLVCSWKASYSFKEASSLDRLAASTKPMLFIHGENDSFVPFEMLDEVFAAKTHGDKEKLVIKDAGHAEAYLREPETYFETAINFLEKYLHA